MLRGLDLGDRELLDVTRQISAEFPALPVLLVVPDINQDLLQGALRSGASDVILVDRLAEELPAALERCRRRVAQNGAVGTSPDGGGTVTTVFSSKGGCGKSLVASNLAILLAQRTSAEVALVDLDLQSGDLAIMFQLLPAWTIYDAALQGERLDEDALHGLLTQHRSSRVQLLAAPLDPALAETVDPETVRRVLQLLKGMFRHVIVDSPAFFSDQVLAAVDETERCVVVGSLDVPSVKNLKLSLQTLEALQIPRQRLHVVLNRADSSVGLRISEVEKSIATNVDVSLPSSRDVPLSINRGEPLALGKPKSPVVSALLQLAESIAPSTNERTAGRRWFARNREE